MHLCQLCNDEFIAINTVSWAINVLPRQSQIALFRCQITICLSFLKLSHSVNIHFHDMYEACSFICLFFFSHILVWQSQSRPVFKECACLGKTFSWGTKFGGEHFPETPYMPFLSRRSVSCQPHRRWIKSIGLLFLLHNAGSVSVLTDPQLINGQDRLLWSWQQVDYQVSCIGVQTGNTCWSDFNWKRKILWKCGRSEAGLQMRKASAQCGGVGKSAYDSRHNRNYLKLHK